MVRLVHGAEIMWQEHSGTMAFADALPEVVSATYNNTGEYNKVVEDFLVKQGVQFGAAWEVLLTCSKNPTKLLLQH